MKFIDEFCAILDEINCNYKHDTSEGGKEMLVLGLSGDNFSGLRYYIFFDDDTCAQIKCFSVCKFTEEKNLTILQTVNSLNMDYRWTTFSATPSGTVMASIDVKATEETAAIILYNALCRINNIIDIAYPILMKALYG